MADLAAQTDALATRVAEEFVTLRGEVGLKLYVQDAEPSWASGEKGLWINTTGGNLQFIVQTGA